MPTLDEMSKRTDRLRPYKGPASPVQPRPPAAARTSAQPCDANGTERTDTVGARRTRIPLTLLSVERRPLEVYIDNPVLTESGSAAFLGLTADCLKKWRQRGRGPDYLQYDPGGPVRYELSALQAYKAAHRVQVRSKK